jgi:uncharacterized protein YjgD (DUF1641 family)
MGWYRFKERIAMAKPVEFREFTPKNARADLMERLQKAPEEHAEALLSTYELLQRMHEKGLLDLANGLLSAGDTVVDRVVDVASSRQAVSALRVVLLLSNLLNSVDPERVHTLLSPTDAKPPSLWKIAKEAMSEEARLGIATTVGLLKVLGSALRK